MIDLHGLNIGKRLADVRRRDLMLLFGVVDRLLVGRSGLIDGALILVQGIRLVEARNRHIAVLGQLADALVGLLRQDTLASARSSAALRAAITSISASARIMGLLRLLRGHRHHVGVEIGDDPDRTGDDEKDDQHAKGESQNIIRAIGAAAQMQKEDEMDADLR